MPQTDKFQGTLTDKELGIIEDALVMSAAFQCYGDGREKHQKQIKTIIKKLYKFWEVK